MTWGLFPHLTMSDWQRLYLLEGLCGCLVGTVLTQPWEGQVSLMLSCNTKLLTQIAGL